MRTSTATWSSWKIGRLGAGEPEAAEVTERAKVFGAAVRDAKQVVLLTVHEDDGSITSRVLVKSKSTAAAERIARAGASAVDASVEFEDEMPTLSASVVSVGKQSSASSASRNTAAGANPVDVAKAFAEGSAPGDFVALSLTEPPKNAVSAYRGWISIRGATDSHYSASTSTVVGSLIVGSSDRSSAGSLVNLVTGLLPGFDVEVKPSTPGTGRWPWVSAGLGLGAWAGLTMLGDAPTAGALAGSVLTAPAPLAATGVIPTKASRLAHRLGEGTVPPPSKNVHRSTPEKKRKDKDGDEHTVSAKTPYPLADDTFLFTPAMVVGLIAPASEAGSGAVVAASRDVPTALRTGDGPVLGVDSKGNRAALDVDALFEGFGVFGIPTAGKSVLMRICLAWNIADRTMPTGRGPGRDHTIIVFEDKGETGAKRSLEYAQTLGDNPLLIDVTDKSTPCIDLFAGSGSASKRASRFVDAMQYAFKDGSIQDLARETLKAVFPTAIWLSEHGHGGVMSLAHRLLGGHGDTDAVSLFTLARTAADAGDQEAVECVAQIQTLFGAEVTPSQRKNASMSSRNKLDQLRDMDWWFDPDRPTVSWTDVLVNHELVILNAGPSINPDVDLPDGETISEPQKALLSSMLLYSLSNTIRVVCNGWKDQGKTVSLFADELSLLAGDKPETITKLRDAYREHGVRCYFATQYPTQLSPALLTTMTSMSTGCWMKQNNSEMAEKAARELSSAGHEWTSADVKSIPLHHAALITSVDGSVQSPSLIRVNWYEEDMATFAHHQGFEGEPVPVVTDRTWVRYPTTVEAVETVETDEVPEPVDPNRFV